MPFTLRRATLLAAGSLAACALPPAAADAARRAPGLLRVHSVRVGTTSAPLDVRVRLPRHATLRAWVNGKRAHHAFHRGGPRIRYAHLTAHNGLRMGRNRIRLVAITDRGRRDVETRGVRIYDPIVDAGRDHVTITDRTLEVGTRRAFVSGAAEQAPLQWRVADAPPGADPTLLDDTTATPALLTEDAGTYTLRLTAGEGDDRAHDTLTVTVRPDDPPIGVPLETLSEDPVAGVWIDGAPVPNVSDRGGVFVVVLERRTRTVVEAGTTPRHGGGLNQLRVMAANYGGSDRYLMLVSSANGVEGDMGGQLRELLKALGAPPQPDWAIAAATSGTPFSIIGIPGGVAGSATVKFPARGASVAAANLKANLQLNQATAGVIPKHYDVVPLAHPTFDTKRPNSDPKSNTIRWNGRDYSATLPPWGYHGFHVLIVDPFSGDVLADNAIISDGGVTSAIYRDAAWLSGQLDRQPAPLVVMQGINHPGGRLSAYNALVDQMVRLGANRYVLNSLNATSDDYALVGRPGAGAPAAEASTTTGEQGELNGVTAPDRTMQLTQVASDPFGELNTELVEVAYQPLQAFPAFDTPGRKAAEGFIGSALGFCARGSALCEMRRRYSENYGSANWTQKATDLAALTFPSDARGFTSDEFAAVKGQLARELSAVSNVEHYFSTLQSPFDRTTGKSILDLNDIADNLKNEFAPPTGDAATSWGLGLASQIAAVGGAIESEVSGGLSAMSAVFSLTAYLTQEDGRSVLGDEITKRAGELGHEMYDRYAVAQQATTGIALLFVSDWGKLQTAAGKIDNAWKLPATMAGASANLKLSAKRWFAESLVPVTFPYLLRASPLPGGSGTAVGTECRLYDAWGQHWFYNHPWTRIDPRSQVRVAEAYEGLKWRYTTLWPSRDFDTYPRSSNVSNLLFNATDARTPGLGLSPLAFFAPDNFGGRVWGANDRANNCDLPKPFR